MRKNYYFLTKCHKILQFFDSPIAIYKTHARWRDNHGNGMQTVVPNSFSILNKKSANIIILFKNEKDGASLLLIYFSLYHSNFQTGQALLNFTNSSLLPLYQVRAVVPFVQRAYIVPTNSAFSGNSLDNYYRTSVL